MDEDEETKVEDIVLVCANCHVCYTVKDRGYLLTNLNSY
ncbi:hypothetical protein ABEY24_20630 [Peribacillus frigoritolerans]